VQAAFQLEVKLVPHCRGERFLAADSFCETKQEKKDDGVFFITH
jgi:hypothetical protein